MTLIPKSIFDEDFNETNVGWCSADNIPQLYTMGKGTVYVPRSRNLHLIPLIRRSQLDIIPVDDPKGQWIKHLEKYEPNHQEMNWSGPYIGTGTTIHPHVIIEENVKIGNNCSIGFEGFGFHKGKRIPHKGRVIIKSGTIISNNVCIDRGVIGDTVIGSNCRIDNLVHIAHNVQVGEGTLIIAGSVICGSVTIGKNVWIAPNSSIRQHLKIGDNAVIGLGSVVVKDVKENNTVMGNPAKVRIRN